MLLSRAVTGEGFQECTLGLCLILLGIIFNVSLTTETDVLGLTYLHQIRKARQCTIIPNTCIISLLIFAYFPLCLSKHGKSNGKANEKYMYQDINKVEDFIFLSENASSTDLTSF